MSSRPHTHLAAIRALGRARFWTGSPIYGNVFSGDLAAVWLDGWRIGEQEFSAVCTKRQTAALLAQHRPADVRQPQSRSRASRTHTGQQGRAASYAATGQDFASMERTR